MIRKRALFSKLIKWLDSNKIIIIKNEKQFTPIEVKFRKKISIPASFLNFIDKYGTDTGIVITKDTIDKRDNLFFIPVVMLPFCSLTPPAKK